MAVNERIVRAIAVRANKILLCRNDKDDFYYLPGGHIEEGEAPELALRRELLEELGAEIERADFLAAVPNTYDGTAGDIHEVNFVYLVTLVRPSAASLEPGVHFEWLDRELLSRVTVLPPEIGSLAARMLATS